MPDNIHFRLNTAPVEARVDAIQAAFEERGMKPKEFIDEFRELAEEKWLPENGAGLRRAWTDPAFKARLMANGRDAVGELGLSMPAHHRHLVVLEHGQHPQRDRLHAVLVHRLRSSACRRTGTRIWSTARASCASRARF